MTDAENRSGSNRRRDALTVLLGPSALGAVAGSIVGTYLAITGSIQEPRVGLADGIGLPPLGAGVGALYAIAGIPIAALTVWWVRRTGSHTGARTVATVAGTAGPAGVMLADASSAPLGHAPATWAVAAFGTLLIAGVLWTLLGRFLPRNGYPNRPTKRQSMSSMPPPPDRKVGTGSHG